jgi:phosphopantothenoylcysteine decarboxylase/phosphopantothenate--cysteine ligase
MHSQKKGHRLNFLITAGGTREYIDPVRFISNASSGRMGYQLAAAARKMGHKVTLIIAPVNLPLPKGVEIIKAESAGDMFKAVKSRFDKCDCLIMAAAVSDYTPVRASNSKIKRGKGKITLKLKPTQDILKWAGQNKVKSKKEKVKTNVVIGFALDDKNLKQNADRKMNEKNLDMIIANKPSAIGEEISSVWIKSRNGNWKAVKNRTKAFIAEHIIKLTETMFAPK